MHSAFPKGMSRWGRHSWQDFAKWPSHLPAPCPAEPSEHVFQCTVWSAFEQSTTEILKCVTSLGLLWDQRDKTSDPTMAQ